MTRVLPNPFHFNTSKVVADLASQDLCEPFQNLGAHFSAQGGVILPCNAEVFTNVGGSQRIPSPGLDCPLARFLLRLSTQFFCSAGLGILLNSKSTFSSLSFCDLRITLVTSGAPPTGEFDLSSLPSCWPDGVKANENFSSR